MRKFAFNRETTKLVVGAVVGFGTGAVVKTIIKTNVSPKGKIDSIGVAIGAWALGGLAGKGGHDAAEEFVDMIFDLYEKYQEKMNGAFDDKYTETY